MLTRSLSGSAVKLGRLVTFLSATLILCGCGGGGGSGGGSLSGFSIARGISVDGFGNVYIAGDTDGILGDTPAGGFDMFVGKSAPGGGMEWIRQFGSPLDETAQGIAVDNGGNIFVAGYTTYGPWNPTGTGESLLLVKYDTTGTGIWSVIIGANGDMGANAVATDSAGNVFVAGFTWSSVDGTPNAGRQDLFVIKLDGDGNVLWSRQMGTPDDDVALGVSIDRARNCYVVGTTYGSLDGHASAGGGDLFLMKFDSGGNKLWSRQMGTSGNDYGKAVATDNSGNVVVAGETYGNMDGNPNAGTSDLFATKFDGSGNKLWSRQMGTNTWDSANAVATDMNGNIYVAGATCGSLDGNTNVDPGAWDLFLVKFDGAGNKQWTRLAGGFGSQMANGAATDGMGNIYAVGGASTGMFTMDYLVVKYDSAGNRL